MSIPIITSILDSDLYKFTMQNCVVRSKFAGIRYDDISVEYEFINRGGTVFPENFDKRLIEQINFMSDLRLTPDEKGFLRQKCYYLSNSYIELLSAYRYDPSEVIVVQNGGELKVTVKGLWWRTILWEVPLMALISQLYFQETLQHLHIDYGQLAKDKSEFIGANKLIVAEFGTRRRYSYNVHDQVVSIMKDNLVGSSNVHFAHKYGLTPIGTMAHEFIMGHAALFGYSQANFYALECWANEYDGALGHALPDTFTTDVFLRTFNLKYAKLFDGLRQDSGKPIAFTDKAVDHYKKLSVDHSSKTIVFSDGLSVGPELVNIRDYCLTKPIKAGFGLGTSLTNDVGVKPLNMVIKMSKCNNMHTVKLSDIRGKESGNPKEIKLCRQTFGV